MWTAQQGPCLWVLGGHCAERGLACLLGCRCRSWPRASLSQCWQAGVCAVGTAVAGRTSQAQGKLCSGGLLDRVGRSRPSWGPGPSSGARGPKAILGMWTRQAGRGRKPRKQKASPPLSSTLSCSGTLSCTEDCRPLPRLAFPHGLLHPWKCASSVSSLFLFVPGPREVTPGHLGPEGCTHGSICDQPGSSEPLAQSESCSPRGGSQRSEVIISSPGC